jgi:hypothetical protein
MPDSLTAGGAGTDGTLNLLNATNEPMLETAITTNPVKRTELKLGATGAPGTLRIKNGAGVPILTANGASGSLSIGGAGGNGSLTISAGDSDGSVQINTSKDNGPQVFLGAANKPARIQLTTGGNPGPTIDLDGSKNALLFQKAGSNTQSTVQVNGNGFINVGGFGTSGRLTISAGDNDGSVQIETGSDGPKVFLGAANKPARIQLTTGGNPGPTIDLDGSKNALLFQKAGSNTDNIVEVNGNGFVRVGGFGKNGQISVRGADGQALAELLAFPSEGVLGLGQSTRPGRISVFGAGGERVRIEANSASLRAGGAGANGTVSVRGKDGAALVELLGGDTEAAIGVGQANRPGRISVFGPAGEAVRIDGQTGDIVLNNADCAEDYDVDPELMAAADPGTVMTFDDEGRLRPATEPYDSRVAGVISGAGAFNPAMVLDRQPGLANRVPLALVGKVFCKVDASRAPVRPGDLLTTSGLRGHAMKVTDATKAFGAVIGKALRPLESGQGLIPITVMAR